jgi:hypothetical protein
MSTITSTDKPKLKYISNFRNGHHFMIPVLDEKGQQAFKYNADGNAKVKDFKMFDFVNVAAHKNVTTGKIDVEAFSFFVVDPEIHGDDYDAIKKELDRECSNPGKYKMFTEDAHFKKRNPEAYAIAKDKKALEDDRDSWKQRADELEKKLGLKANPVGRPKATDKP